MRVLRSARARASVCSVIWVETPPRRGIHRRVLAAGGVRRCMTSKTHRTWAVILTGVGSLMAALDTLVVATALPTIRVDLGASVEQLEWTVNAYNLSFAVLLM